MLRSISSEPGILEEILQPLAYVFSLLPCGTSGVVVFPRNAVTALSPPL